MKEIRIDAPIVPGLSAAGLSIGDDLHSLHLGIVRPGRKLGEISVYEIGPVTIWLKAGIVDQIGVGKGYQGRLFDRLMIGSTIAEVEESCALRLRLGGVATHCRRIGTPE